MRLRYRITILIVLAIIFFIVSPVLIIRTLGYRYNPKKHSIEKTGLLAVKTEPSKADIYLNGKKQSAQTPASIKYLLPDNYNLKIEKDGYVPFEKQVAIKSGLATFEDSVLLFKQNLPVLITPGNIKKIAVSNNKNAAAFIQSNGKKLQVGILNFGDDTVKTIYQLSSPDFKPEMNWSSSDDKLFIYDPSNLKYPIYTIKTKEPYDAESNVLGSKIAENYYVKDGLVYYIKDNELVSREIKKSQENKILTLPYKNYFLHEIIDLYFVFKNNLNDKLLVLNDKAQIIFDDYGKEIVFGKDKTEFVVDDEFEMNLYNAEKREKNFINRSSQKIKNIFFLEGKNYIVYILSDGVYTIEKKTEDLTKATQILTNFNNIESALLDLDQKNFYILGEINDGAGIYKLNFR
jgi:hypothetical protein